MSRDGRAVKRVLWITLGLNVAVAVAKLGYGASCGVLSMVADGIHSALDGANNVIGLIALHAAGQPPDAEHPYGHRKFETFASLSLAGMLLLACYEVLRTALGRVTDPQPAQVGVAGFAIMFGTLGVNALVTWYEQREGRRLGSEFLLADAAHTRSDVLATLSVLVALGATSLGIPHVDLLVTLLIVAWIARLAWQVFTPAFSTLADEARVDPAAVETAARGVPGVLDVHRVRSRGAMDHVFLDLHVQVAPDSNLADAHAVSHAVENTLRTAFPHVVDVTVHVEPHGDPIEGLDGSVVPPEAGR